MSSKKKGFQATKNLVLHEKKSRNWEVSEKRAENSLALPAQLAGLCVM